jgi:hypothetical protein
MKPVKSLLISLLCLTAFLLPLISDAQCSAGLTKTISFDTVVTGTGNNNYNFTTPQFSPATGTLIAVVIKTKVSIGLGFHAENTDNSSRSVNIGAGRYDYLSCPALYNSFYAGSVQKNYGPYSLAASDGVPNSGDDYLAVSPFPFLQNEIVLSDSIITSIENFLGYGNVDFGYYPSTYSVIPQNLSYNFSANDTMHFGVTYYYCNSQTLPVNIINFSAIKVNDQQVQLNWQNKSEEKSRLYEIEKSSDGKIFSVITSLPADMLADGSGDYLDEYKMTPDDKSRIYFRLKIKNSDGSIDYSAIRFVDLNAENETSVYLYPNPCSNFLNITLRDASEKNLHFDIYTALGGLIQHDDLPATNTVVLKFKNKLAAGVYFLRLTDQQSLKTQTQRFVVQ